MGSGQSNFLACWTRQLLHARKVAQSKCSQRGRSCSSTCFATLQAGAKLDLSVADCRCHMLPVPAAIRARKPSAFGGAQISLHKGWLVWYMTSSTVCTRKTYMHTICHSTCSGQVAEEIPLLEVIMFQVPRCCGDAVSACWQELAMRQMLGRTLKMTSPKPTGMCSRMCDLIKNLASPTPALMHRQRHIWSFGFSGAGLEATLRDMVAELHNIPSRPHALQEEEKTIAPPRFMGAQAEGKHQVARRLRPEDRQDSALVPPWALRPGAMVSPFWWTLPKNKSTTRRHPACLQLAWLGQGLSTTTVFPSTSSEECWKSSRAKAWRRCSPGVC